MAVSGVNSTPQPEQNNFASIKKEEDQFAESIFNRLNKDKNNVIDEKDGIDRSMLAALKNFVGATLTLENLKKVAGTLSNFTYTKAGKYNGTKANITYDIWGDIRSVNTGAKNETEARAHMGLDKKHIVGRNTGDITTYGREFKKANGKQMGTQEEYFVWNPNTKSMDFEWGCWSAD